MARKIDKVRKQISVWGETGQRIKCLSEKMEISQVELIHQAILAFEGDYIVRKKEGNNPQWVED